MNSTDYRTWQDFLIEEAQKYSWHKISDGVYDKAGVRIKIAHRGKGHGFQVVTFLKHPQWGDTSLIRENISREEMVLIFKNPRTHTGKGWNPNSPKRRLERAFKAVGIK